MTVSEQVAALEHEWSLDEGFFGKLREGVFSAPDFERAIALLRGIEVPREMVSSRLVSLLWFAAPFMSWQRERLVARGGQIAALDAAITQVTNELERILGVP